MKQPRARLDELTVLVDARCRGGRRRQRRSRSPLARQVESRIGVSAGVRVVPCGGIERSVGKAKRVVDKRPKT